MATLTSVLPAPVRSYEVFADGRPATALAATQAQAPAHVPPYGHRKGFVPKSQADFADGGAYPEIHVAQYPLDMGRPGKASVLKTASLFSHFPVLTHVHCVASIKVSLPALIAVLPLFLTLLQASSTAIVPVAVDGKTGQARFDAIVTAQHGGDKPIQTQFGDLVEKRPDAVIRARPSAEEEAEAVARTRAALEGIVNTKIAHARPGYVTADNQSRAESASYVRYTPAEDANGYNPATKQRIIRMVEAQVDPMEPPKFKHKKVPGGPGDAPVPVMHSPPRKLTVADQAAWSIPPCTSNWKNSRGYVVPLDKRVAADGRSLLEPSINDGFAKLSEALLIAERKARVEVETRAAIAKRLALKEREGKEAELRAIAAKSRLERAGVALPAGTAAYGGSASAGGADFEGVSSSSSSSLGARAGSRGAGGVGTAGPTGGVIRSRADMAASDDRDDYYAASSGSASASARAGGRARDLTGYGDADDDEGGEGDDAAGREERERMRREFRRDKEREMRGQFDAEGNERPSKRARGAGRGGEEDRDISEKVALGMPVGRGAAGAGAEGLYDARLFGQSEGIGAGFSNDEEYSVYSKAWRTDAATATGSAIYRPRTAGAGGAYDPQAAEAAVASLRGGGIDAGTDFEGVRQGQGAKGSLGRGGVAGGGPVQFEKSYGTGGAMSAAPAASAGGGRSGGGGGASGDLFGLDKLISETSGSASGSASGRPNALDGIGRARGHGFMAAAAGGVGKSAADYSGPSSRSSIAFESGGVETAGGSGSSSSSGGGGGRRY